MHYYNIFIQIQQEQTIGKEEIALILYVTFIVIIFFVMIVIFFVTFQKRKTKLLRDNFMQQQAFDEELSKSQIEIQEQTLKHVGRELHDNLGQLLAFANMQLNAIRVKAPDTLKNEMEDATQIIKDSLTEVRALSRSLNNDVLLNMGLKNALDNELLRLKRLGVWSIDFELKGEKRELNDKTHDIIIFRILQEFLSNTIKYAEASKIKVILDYQKDQLVIRALDDGIGFDMASVEKGSGLINMEHRAALIGASFNLESQIREGVILTITYPFM